MPSILSRFQLHLYKLRRVKSLAAMEFKVLRLDGEQLPGGRIALCGGFFKQLHGFFAIALNQRAGKYICAKLVCDGAWPSLGFS